MHAAFYEEIHTRGNTLATRESLARFFERFGVDRAAFDAAFDSAGVAARVQRAAALASELSISVTPSIVVAGRYATDPGRAGPALLEVVDQLVADAALDETVRRLQRPAAGPGRDLRPASSCRGSQCVDLERVKGDRIEAYSWLLEGSTDPAAPPFVQFALAELGAGLTPQERAEAEQRFARRRVADEEP
jgi:hypothetical protein